MKKNKGFTLLELLVVLVIIGLLAAIVMSALSSARKRGGDAGIKSNLHTVRNQAAIFFANNNTFGATYDGGGAGGDNCPAVEFPSGQSMFQVDKVIISAINKALNDAGGVLTAETWCYNNATTWAVAVNLKSNPAYSWCVDSSGKSKQVNAIPQLAVNSTTHLCN